MERIGLRVWWNDALFRAMRNCSTCLFTGLAESLGLMFPERGIETLQEQQFSMVVPFHDAPLIINQDFIRLGDRAEAMSNGEHRHQLGQLDRVPRMLTSLRLSRTLVATSRIRSWGCLRRAVSFSQKSISRLGLISGLA